MITDYTRRETYQHIHEDDLDQAHLRSRFKKEPPPWLKKSARTINVELRAADSISQDLDMAISPLSPNLLSGARWEGMGSNPVILFTIVEFSIWYKSVFSEIVSSSLPSCHVVKLRELVWWPDKFTDTVMSLFSYQWHSRRSSWSCLSCHETPGWHWSSVHRISYSEPLTSSSYTSSSYPQIGYRFLSSSALFSTPFPPILSGPLSMQPDMRTTMSTRATNSLIKSSLQPSSFRAPAGWTI